MSRNTRDIFSGQSVLIVEDQLMIALEVVNHVEGLGCTVVGPAGSVDEAIALLAESAPDAALLDVNLSGQRVTPVAQACQDRDIPFALVTGYGRLELEEALLQSAPRVHKPFNLPGIQQALANLLAAKRKR